MGRTRQQTVKREQLKVENHSDEEMIVEVKLETLSDYYQCRGCRKEVPQGLISIYDDDLKDVYFALTGIEIKNEDPAPKFLCESCRDNLKNFFMFRTTCIESNNYFFEVLKEMSIVSTKREIFVDPIKFEPEEKPPKKQKKVAEKPKKTKLIKTKIKTEPGLDIDRLICNECDRTLNRKSFLWHWRYKHQVDESPSTCHVCSSTFSSIWKIERHLRKAHGILKCFKCDRREVIHSRDPKVVKKFLSHARLCNKDPEDDPFACRYCSLRYATYKQYISHETNCTGPTILCHICCKSVKKTSIALHMERHSTENFPCRTCGKNFRNKFCRGIHEKLACTFEACICDYCSKEFQNKSKLLQHFRRSHVGVKKLPKKQCTVCGAIVRKLKDHMFIHSGVRKYQCDFEGCEATFRQHNSLKKHKHTHSKTRPYNCQFPGCSIGYYCTDYLRGHYKRSHGLIYDKSQPVPYNRPPGWLQQ